MTPAVEDNSVERFLAESLFDALPQAVALIGPDHRIRAVNSTFEGAFGVFQGRLCHEACKQTHEPCHDCEADLALRDNQTRVSDQRLVDRHGRSVDAAVTFKPVSLGGGDPDHVLLLLDDLVETRRWKREYDRLFEHVPCYISILDRELNIVRANGNLQRTFGKAEGVSCYRVYKGRGTPCRQCPAKQTFTDGEVHTSTQSGVDREGNETHYFVTASPLSWDADGVDRVIEISTDVTKLRRLEKEVVENERLAAVGQTVAGLAHTIKNLLMGLEGGMYMVDSGLQRGDEQRLATGWDMLQRNFEKTNRMVRDFLSFAKGRVPKLLPTDPTALLREVVDLYADTARQQGVELTLEPAAVDPDPAPLDREGIEACLTNLLSNAIDAARVREGGGGAVRLAAYDKDGALILEVQDNGIGMETDVKRKVFTTFFTTKGNQGTGLGLLTTRKIVQEHGGVIEVDTRHGEGSIFRIQLPRHRLAAIADDQQHRDEKAEQFQL